MALRDLMPWSSHSNVPVRRHDGDPIVELQQRMNRLFENVWDDDFALAPFGRQIGQFVPSVNVSEDDQQVVVEAELPGLEEKDLDVSVERGALILRGEKKTESESKDRGYTHVERSYGSFSRTIPLSCEVDPDKVNAKFKNGVLTVTLPKSEPAKQNVRKIEVKND